MFKRFLEGIFCPLVSYRVKRCDDLNYYRWFLSHQSGMMIAPVLANLGPIEELTFKPNPGEVQLFNFNFHIILKHTSVTNDGCWFRDDCFLFTVYFQDAILRHWFF